MSDWIEIASVDELAKRNKLVKKIAGKQLLILKSGDDIHVCNNRCPHEGYPLSEGTLTDNCILTCNWHNWKFDLTDGETLVGGDKLRRYDARVDEGAIYADLSDPPVEETRREIIFGLHAAFKEHDTTRLSREVIRYQQTGANPEDLITHALGWTQDQLEYGMTHAHAAGADWLSLRDEISDKNPVDKVIPLTEMLGHLSWDCITDPKVTPYPEDIAPEFDSVMLEEAIEKEDEALAVAHVNAALRDGQLADLRTALERASLAHYQGFGHPPIYLTKTFDLIDRLGPEAARPLLLPLTRNYIMATREDLIPEFRGYGTALSEFSKTPGPLPSVGDFRNKGVGPALKLIASTGPNYEALCDVLMQAAAEALLYYDGGLRAKTAKPVSQNIDFLDFSHAITHLNASRKICLHQPGLWPKALLQTGCFLGRNANAINWTQDVSHWSVSDPEEFFADRLDQMLDHGEPLYIYPAHWLKTTIAIREEVKRAPDAAFVPALMSALNRFLNEPMKRKHARRDTWQAHSLVAANG